MDLSNLVANKHTVIHLQNIQTGEKLYCDEEKQDPFTWTTLSKHTREYKKLFSSYTEQLKEQFGDKRLTELTFEESEKLEELTIGLIAATSTDFNLIMDGKKLKFNKSIALKLLSDESLFWIKDQVGSGANEAKNFMMA